LAESSKPDRDQLGIGAGVIVAVAGSDNVKIVQ